MSGRMGRLTFTLLSFESFMSRSFARSAPMLMSTMDASAFTL